MVPLGDPPPRLQPLELAYLPHPAKLPEIAINLLWHTKSHKDHAVARGFTQRINARSEKSAAVLDAENIHCQ